MRKIMILVCLLLALSPGVFAEGADIKTTIAACADITSFDIKDYDYDRLFKYVLYTHENFRVLTDIDPETGVSSTSGYSNISLVRSEFIDYVMNNVFRITPEKPPVSALTERGFCYNNGYYLYTGGFDVYFATEIKDIVRTEDLGSGVTLVIFNDTYREENAYENEQSFAILQENGDGYSLLRLGMGEEAPDESTLLAYLPKSVSAQEALREDGKSRFWLAVFLGVFAAGIFGLACSVVFLTRIRRK